MIKSSRNATFSVRMYILKDRTAKFLCEYYDECTSWFYRIMDSFLNPIVYNNVCQLINQGNVIHPCSLLKLITIGRMGENGLNIPAISNRHSVWPRDLPVEHLLSLQPFISPEPIQYGTEGKFSLNYNLLENRITNLYLSKWITYVHASLKTFKILIYFLQLLFMNKQL